MNIFYILCVILGGLGMWIFTGIIAVGIIYELHGTENLIEITSNERKILIAGGLATYLYAFVYFIVWCYRNFKKNKLK